MTIGGLSQLQDLVGGYLEEVPLRVPGVFGYVDENGEIEGRRYNLIATELADRPLSDWIAGPMVILGAPDRWGKETDVPEDIIGALTGGTTG